MATIEPIEAIAPGTRLLLGGDRWIQVPDDIAARFRPGDALYVAEASERVLLVPARERRIAAEAVGRALDSFAALQQLEPAAIARFYEGFASRLEDDAVWSAVADINARDVEDARARGRSTTRLVASDKLRRGMIDGLRGWVDAPSRHGEVLESVPHDGWRADLVGAALGVVAFVFEGRPNVLADATGVLRGGNAVVLRIGSDALRTARAIVDNALAPALRDAGLPEGAVVLVDSTEHAAGWAMFSDSRLALAVARGSGPTVAMLGALARQAGVAVSLHGTGGAWIVAAPDVTRDALRTAIVESLDRKVCNTLNTLCLPRAAAATLVPVALEALQAAGERIGHGHKLHVARGDVAAVPEALFERKVQVRRAQGDVEEPLAQALAEDQLGHEWEWEQTPEVTLKLVDDVDEAIDLFNRYSPRFIASLVGGDARAHERFYQRVEAPFVGDGPTRWVDGQKALKRPELGLSNWQNGRLLARGGILSGDGVYSVRTRARTTRS